MHILFLEKIKKNGTIPRILDGSYKYNRTCPKSHNGQTKQAYFGFINDETLSLSKQYQGNPFDVAYGVVDRTFKNTSKKCGIKIYPHLETVSIRVVE